ncbi:hypothetical protein EVAR_40044_1 [Eumeta japonica]|uniref:Uncharacterized protein n=1 Tax=Eumeta variegata TaxID=151549 RepID=A0A4C1W8F9_EUMVA|nr:hypothetical protein EVAR_40044_1 [Eumeta japonica]
MLCLPVLRRGVKLGVVTVDETSIYCYDSKTKQQSTVCVYRDEPTPIKVERERSASMRMITSFYNKTGHVATVAMQNCVTGNSDWHTIICLPKGADTTYYELKRSPAGCAPRAPSTPIEDSIHAEYPCDSLCRDSHLVASIGQSRADGIPCRSAAID